MYLLHWSLRSTTNLRTRSKTIRYRESNCETQMSQGRNPKHLSFGPYRQPTDKGPYPKSGDHEQNEAPHHLELHRGLTVFGKATEPDNTSVMTVRVCRC